MFSFPLTRPWRWATLLALAICASPLLAQPVMEIRSGGVPIAHMGTFAQGNHSEPTFGIPLQIHNTGTSDLNVSSGALSGAMNCSMSTTATFPRIVAPGMSYSLNIAVTLSAVGAFSAVFTAQSNDTVTPSYAITLSGTATNDPNIRVTYAGGGINNGSSQNIGSTYAPGSGYNITITVTNFAIATASGLTFNPANSLDLQSSTNCTVMLPADPTGTLNPGASANIVLNVTPVTAGAFSFVPRVYTNDPDTGTWSATFNGTATTTPVIRWYVGGGYRPPNSTATVTGASWGAPHVISCQLENLGSQNLVLSGAPLVQFSAQTNCNCTLPTPPPSTLAPGVSMLFEIAMTATAAGNFSFDATISSNDPANSSYVVHFSGATTGAPPNITILLGGTAQAHNATFTATGAAKGTLFNIQGGVQNSGGTTLNLSGTPLVAISAQSNCTATLTAAPLAAVPATQTSSFVIAVTPANSGAFSFDITVASDDPDTPGYVVHVQGSASSPGSGDDDSGCSTSAGGAGLAGLLSPLAALALLLRRRRKAEA